MTSPTPTGATTGDAPASPAGDGAPIVDDTLVHVDPQLHSPGQPPGVTGPTRPNIVRAFPSRDDNQQVHDVTPGAPLDQPEHAATKAAWVDFAISQGADRDEAEKTRKDDLIATYGSES